MRIALITAAALVTAACGGDNQDRLDDNMFEEVAQAPAEKADSRCGSVATVAALKRELFSAASVERGSNATAYARIADFAVLVLDDARPSAPVSAVESVDCRAKATLRLPPNLRAAGDRGVIDGTIAYNVSAGANPVVTLGAAEGIVEPLATLRKASAAPEPEEAPVETPAPAKESEEPIDGPSFNCERASRNAEYAVCASPALSSLDRSMAQQYRSARASASPDQARLLSETRDRFLGFRNACGSDDCIAQTYRGRMREIDDIMTGRWQPTR